MSLAVRVNQLAQRIGQVLSSMRAWDQGTQVDPNTGFSIIEQKTITVGDTVHVELLISGSFPSGVEQYVATLRSAHRPIRYTSGSAVTTSDTNTAVGSASAYLFPAGTIIVANGNRTNTRARIHFSYVRI